MTQPEARLQRRIQAELKLQGWFVFKVHGSEFMMAGLPDLIVCAEGLFIGLEVKMPGEQPSNIQTHVHGKIRSAGGAAYVVYTPQQALDAVFETLTAAGIVQ
jgi:Holliday junction resolvase